MNNDECLECEALGGAELFGAWDRAFDRYIDALKKDRSASDEAFSALDKVYRACP